MTVRTLTDFQISYLRGLFYRESAPPPHNTRVNKIGRSDEGSLIIEYEDYGRMQTVSIKYTDTAETFIDPPFCLT